MSEGSAGEGVRGVLVRVCQTVRVNPCRPGLSSNKPKVPQMADSLCKLI